jgi:hypothetical protein
MSRGSTHEAHEATPERRSQPELIAIGGCLCGIHRNDGCARGAPSRVQAAIGQNSTKTAIPQFIFYLAGGQLGRAVPGSRGTSPGEPSGAVGALPGRRRRAPRSAGAARRESPALVKG